MPDFSGVAVTTPHCILLSGNPIYAQQTQAAAAITPGHLVEIVSGGGIRRHGTADGNALTAWALENVTPDRTVATQAIDTPYATGETVKWMIARPGDMIYAWVPASASAIVAGDFLASNGDGTLHKAVTGSTFLEAIVGQAVEAVNNSAGGTPARIRVRSV
jgi:hypothetical protein